MLPEWVTEGARVAIEFQDRYEVDVVDYLTKTQIVLSSGRRFRLNLIEVGSGRGTLVDPRDSQVGCYFKRNAVGEFGFQAEEVTRQVRNDVQLDPSDAFNQISALYARLSKQLTAIDEGNF